MAGEPKFYSKNFVDVAAGISSDNPASDATLSRLFDRDKDQVFKSSGVATDATPVNITIIFQAGGIEFSRTFDTLVVLGHNLANLTLQRFDGASFVNVPGGVIVGETNAFTVVTFAAITASRVRLIAQTTQTPNQEKEVGQFLVLSTLFAFATDRGLDRIGFRPSPTAIVTPMADGGRKITLLRWTGNRVERFVVGIQYTQLTISEYDSLRSVIRTAVFTAFIEPVERPQEYFQSSAIEGGAPSSHVSPFKGNGFNLNMQVREI